MSLPYSLYMVTHPSDPSEHAKHFISCHVLQGGTLNVCVNYGSLNCVHLNFVASYGFVTLSGENWQLVTDEPVEFEKWPVEVGDFRRTTDHFRGIYRIYTPLKQIRKNSTCNRLDLQCPKTSRVLFRNFNLGYCIVGISPTRYFIF